MKVLQRQERITGKGKITEIGKYDRDRKGLHRQESITETENDYIERKELHR